jgi:S-adenosylmethionine:tRNA ribosyltransferase-isomerase
MPHEHPLIREFAYEMTPELIAHEPVTPRDQARLLVYDIKTETVSHRHVYDLPTLIPNSHIVFNDTKVLPARIFGGYHNEPIEVLVLVDQGMTPLRQIRALVNRYVEIGATITVGELVLTVVDNKDKAMVLESSLGEKELWAFLLDAGVTPLPPYINTNSTEITKRTQYQTIFADTAPSVAAPTASLHFTPELLTKLQEASVTTSTVTLQVGLGTFAPIWNENFERKKLHEEYFMISDDAAQSICRAQHEQRPIVAVGTTVVRTLESAKTAIGTGVGTTGVADLFIYPPYTFTYPDILMTNFHVPKSSLMCLVQAFIAHKGGKRHLTDIYKEAIEEGYRFYSFGDAMLVV